MRTDRARRRQTAVIALLLAIVWFSAACSMADDGARTDPTVAAPPPAPSIPASITIGYLEVPTGDLIVKTQAWLETALPDTEIAWKAFDSGEAVNQAFREGELDIGVASSGDVANGISQGLNYLVPWIHAVERLEASEVLAVVSEEFATAYPDALTIWAEQQNRAVALIRDDPDEAAAVLAGALGLDAAEVRSQLASQTFLDATQQAGPDWLGGGLALVLHANALLAADVGTIGAAAPLSTYEDAVVATYAAAVSDG